MLEDSFNRVYNRFKHFSYERLFASVREDEGALSTMDCFALEVIHLLNKPTVSQFADFLGVSQSNATYKINSLQSKGYVIRENSVIDRREFHLVTTDKYHRYMSSTHAYQRGLIDYLKANVDRAELQAFEKVMNIIDAKLAEDGKK